MLPSIFVQLGWLSVALPLLGLIASYKLRTKRWSVFMWAPTTALLIYYLIETLRSILSLSGVSGPDAIGVGFLFIAQLILVSIQAIGLFLSYKARPSKSTNQPIALPLSLLAAFIVIFIAGNRVGAVNITLTFVDSTGSPIQGAEVNTVLFENGLGIERYSKRTGSDGTLSLSLRKAQTSETKIRPLKPKSGYDPSEPTYWNFDLSFDKSGLIAIRHSWQRSIGNVTLNESFVQLFPAEGNIDTTISIPAKNGIHQPFLRGQITNTIRDFNKYPSERYGYGYLGRNVEAIESLEWLIELYESGSENKRSIASGLERIADMLGDLDRALTYLQSLGQKNGGFDSDRIHSSTIKAVQQFLDWSEYKGNDLEEGLLHARSKLQNSMATLVGFVRKELENNNELSALIGGLKKTSYPAYAQFIDIILESPPGSVASARRWSHELRLVRDKDSSPLAYNSLLLSPDPLVLLVGFEHAKSNRDFAQSKIAKTLLLNLLPKMEDRDLAEEISRLVN